MTGQTVEYRVGVDIRNLAALPAGTGCRFLRCVVGPDGALVAKSWHRKQPTPKAGEVVVAFRVKVGAALAAAESAPAPEPAPAPAPAMTAAELAELRAELEAIRRAVDAADAALARLLVGR